MSRSLRGTGPRPVHRGTLARAVFGRERHLVRRRVIACAAAGGVAALVLALVPVPELQEPVLETILTEAPAFEVSALSTLLSGAVGGLEPRFERVTAPAAGLNPERLSAAGAAVRQEVRRGSIPGAALVVGRRDRLVEKEGFGLLGPSLGPVDPDSTLYDLASLTKVIATTTAVMLLVEEGRMRLDEPVATYLPEFAGGGKERVTVRQLLTHTSGLPAGAAAYGPTRDAALRRLIATPLKTKPGEKVVYSDVGPVILMAAAERVAAEPIEVLLQRRVFRPLGMRRTGFNPIGPCDRCAPTAATIHGRVHDPISQRLGGVAGNAGLFATATDVARFAAMLANGGELEGVRILKEETVREFTRPQQGSGTRALGWDTRTAGPGRSASRAYGHTGFTGTSLWIDPERGTWAVLLSNRTFVPKAPNRMQALRRTVNERLAEAVDPRLAE